MLRDHVQNVVAGAISAAVAAGEIPTLDVPIEVQDPRNPEHGDFALNYALIASKPAGMQPRALAEIIASRLNASQEFALVEVAGPGFINLRVAPLKIASYVDEVRSLGVQELPKQSPVANPKKLHLEFVSVNPNGPITVGSGRNAALGDAMARALRAAGHQVHTEYYVNDGVNSEQMREFARSVRYHVRLRTPMGQEAVQRLVDAIKFFRDYRDNGSSMSAELLEAAFPLDDRNEIDDQEVLISRLESSKKKVDEWFQNRKQELENQSIEALVLKGDAGGLLPYRGTYVEGVAATLMDSFGNDIDSKPLTWFQEHAQQAMIEVQKSDLEYFGVKFDAWFREQSMHDAGLVSSAIAALQANGSADDRPVMGEFDQVDGKPVYKETGQQPGPLWLRSTKYGDDKDRVLLRSDGRPAYIAGDVAYMYNKLADRGFDKSIIILGPDHHGYIGRMNAVCEVLGFPLERFEIVIYQIVRFLKDGKPAPMRKRDGNIYELQDLMLELGKAAKPEATEEEQMIAGRDAARFFYLMRSRDSHMDFDIDLATKQNDDNPLFYVQYAHARVCSVLAKAAEEGFASDQPFDASLITDPRELALVRKVLDLPYEVRRCADDYGVHRLVTYATELARTYHAFYDSCRVIQKDQPELTKARVAVCRAAQIGLQSVLEVMLGVTAPQRM